MAILRGPDLLTKRRPPRDLRTWRTPAGCAAPNATTLTNAAWILSLLSPSGMLFYDHVLLARVRGRSAHPRPGPLPSSTRICAVSTKYELPRPPTALGDPARDRSPAPDIWKLYFININPQMRSTHGWSSTLPLYLAAHDRLRLVVDRHHPDHHARTVRPHPPPCWPGKLVDENYEEKELMGLPASRLWGVATIFLAFIHSSSLIVWAAPCSSHALAERHWLRS